MAIKEDSWDVRSSREEDMQANFVKFHYVNKLDEEASKEAKRPIYKKVEYIMVKIPGDKFTSPDRPVKERDRRVYAKRYAAFLADQDQDASTGTLLKAWTLLDPSCRISDEVIEELAFYKIRTVEQMADVNDSNLAEISIPKIRDMRQRAREYLESAKSVASAAQLQGELAKRDAMIDEMRQQIAALAKGPEPVTAPEVMPKVKRKPGRPKAAPMEEPTP